MPEIQVLSTHVADLIAAGEVVERPASVVKELTENAVDAGASVVTVEIQNGGMGLIRVTDDGKGIAPDEVETAFLRHATSKIRTEYDLDAIGTLGFRGEALAAIASVSRMEALTRREADGLGCAITLEGGVVVDKEEAGCPAGTTMMVRDLFYNTPARLKFMKKDSAEGAACLAVVQKQALAHPEVSFRFLRDGRQELLTPGDGQLRSALYAVLGRDMALGYTPVEGSGEDMKVSGFVSLPTCCRGNRGYQFFFVNGRSVKSAALTAAVEQAYANQKMVGKFPGCVLHLTIRLNAVDVNVHPTKQEVKFGAERQVFSAVYYAVLAALGADKSRPAATVGAAVTPRTEVFQQTSLPLHDFTAPKRSDSVGAAPGRPEPVPAAALKEEGEEGQCGGVLPHKDAPPRTEIPTQKETAAKTGLMREQEKATPAMEREIPAVGQKFSDTGRDTPVMERGTPAPHSPQPSPTAQISPPPTLIEETAQETPWRVAGELFHTYIIVEQGDKALLIDKHAAHERMNFDRMRAEDYTPMSQMLLTPVVFTPTPEEHTLLLENGAELDRVGFGIEDFGGGSLVVRRVPDYVDVADVEASLTEIEIGRAHV